MFKVYGYLDDKQVLNLAMPALPTIGQHVCVEGREDELLIVTSIVWRWDLPPHAEDYQKVDLVLEHASAQRTSPHPMERAGSCEASDIPLVGKDQLIDVSWEEQEAINFGRIQAQRGVVRSAMEGSERPGSIPLSPGLPRWLSLLFLSYNSELLKLRKR